MLRLVRPHPRPSGLVQCGFPRILRARIAWGAKCRYAQLFSDKVPNSADQTGSLMGLVELIYRRLGQVPQAVVVSSATESPKQPRELGVARRPDCGVFGPHTRAGTACAIGVRKSLPRCAVCQELHSWSAFSWRLVVRFLSPNRVEF
jgi:hypothetical protein